MVDLARENRAQTVATQQNLLTEMLLRITAGTANRNRSGRNL